ncbi:hypothetical protein JW935_25625 [candidate division KSB1 bacterium]|nr:hypothetical protein [candidate division KSB1 bacterium]
MLIVIIYLLALLFVNTVVNLLVLGGAIKIEPSLLQIGFHTFMLGLLGGTIHCLRSAYIHHSVLKDWDKTWTTWYYLRPVISSFMGVLSFIFIKAGLLIFTADAGSNLSADSGAINAVMGYLAIAFLVGYNVQSFLKKIEDVSKTTLGIEPMDTDDGGK